MRKGWMLMAVFAAVIAIGFSAQSALAQGSVVGQVIDADDNPVEGAHVMIHQMGRGGHGNRGFSARTETNQRGVFEFPRVPEGNYMIAAGAEDLGRAHEEIEVVDDEATRVRLQLQEGRGGGRGGDDREVGVIVGHVQTPGGDPVAGAMIMLHPLNHQRGRHHGGMRTRSDREGNFVMMDIPAGEYIIMARVRGGAARARIEVIADQRNRVRLVLHRVGRGDDGGGGGRDLLRN